jgi:transaldolase
MIFFIDSANLDEIKKANDLGVINGVTTNPSLIAKEHVSGKNSILDHYKKICDLAAGEISAEVISIKFKDIVKEGHQLAEIDKKIVVKIPIIEDGLKAIDYFAKKKIKTNCTLVFSAAQALLAAKSGATYVSPFMGRIDDWNKKPSSSLEIVSDIKTIFQNYNYRTKILAASIRSPKHIIECAKIGTDVVTAPFTLLKSLIKHPLTDSGLKKFIDDYKTTYFKNIKKEFE